MKAIVGLFLCNVVLPIDSMTTHETYETHGRTLNMLEPEWWLVGAICGGIVVLFAVVVSFLCWNRYRHRSRIRRVKREVIRNMVRREVRREVQLEAKRTSTMKGVSRREYLRR